MLIDGFHIDTAKIRPLGGGYRDNELFEVMKEYRMLVYEDVEDRQEWGLPYGSTNRLVRALAQKSVALPTGCAWEGRRYREGQSMCWGVAKWSCSAEGGVMGDGAGRRRSTVQ